MKFRTTLIFAVLLVALGAFYYVYEIRQGPHREKAEAEKDRLYAFEAKDVEGLSLARKGEAVTLKREGEGWVLLEPIRARAEKSAAEALIGTIAGVRREREIEAAPEKLADYGLENPSVRITVTAKGQSHSLLLGERTPTGVWIYAKSSDKPAVFLLSDSLLRDSEKKVGDLRDKTILAFERKEVKGIEVRARGQILAAEESTASGAAGAEWRMTAPVQVKADRERISAFLEKLGGKIREFVEENPKDLARYGLDRPTEVRLLIGQEKDRSTRVLLFGKVEPSKKGLYAMRQGDPSVFLLDAETWAALPQTAADLRDKTFFAFDRSKVERLELESPKGKVALVKQGDRWLVAAPVQARADEGAVSNLLRRLQDLRATEFVADKANLESYGLTKPDVRAIFWEKETKSPGVLLLAKAGKKDQAYAALAGEGRIVLVEAATLADLGKSADELRDKSLFDFETKDVKRIQLKAGSQLFVMERRGEDEWGLIEPKKGTIRGFRVGEFLWSIRRLKWEVLVAEKGERASQYGLEPPTGEITLWKTDGNEIATLFLGRKEKDRTYLRTKTSPAVYLIDAKALGELPKSVDDLLG